MLKPIPPQILKTTATVRVCTGVDRYQNQTYAEYTVKRVYKVIQREEVAWQYPLPGDV